MTQAAFSGAVAGLRLMVDDTVRITIDFEPKDRAAVMAALGRTGQPVAVAALVIGHAAKEDKPRDQRGPLCREACDLCELPGFQDYVTQEGYANSAEGVKQYILDKCGVDSRKELDTNDAAADEFKRRFRSQHFLKAIRW